MRLTPARSSFVIVGAVAAVLLLAAPVLAHAELTSSDPSAGSILDSPPSEIVLTFDNELDPDGSDFTVTDADGATVATGEVDLDVADRNVLRGSFDDPASGTFTVSWTALSIDGHAEDGTFSFTVGSGADAPDTALEHPSSSLTPIGLLLLIAGILAGSALARPSVPR